MYWYLRTVINWLNKVCYDNIAYLVENLGWNAAGLSWAENCGKDDFWISRREETTTPSCNQIYWYKLYKLFLSFCFLIQYGMTLRKKVISLTIIMSVKILFKATVCFLRRILEVMGFWPTFSKSFVDDLQLLVSDTFSIT